MTKRRFEREVFAGAIIIHVYHKKIKGFLVDEEVAQSDRKSMAASKPVSNGL
jgi:hypothetical protein